jgi:hypothetical protein
MIRRHRLSRALTVVAAAALVFGVGAPAHADDGPPSGQFSGGAVSDHSAGFTGTSTSTSSTPSSSGSSSTGSSSSGGSGTSSTGSSGTSTFPGLGSASGGPGTGACDPAAYAGGYSPTLAVPSPCAPVEECGAYQGSTFVTQACPADPAAPGPRRPPPPPQITTAMVTEAARVTAPTNAPHVEPGTVSYVNIPNNYWTETATVNDAVTILGVTIPLRWTPTSTTWNFGDGGTGAGDGIQGADVGAPGAIEHAYSRQGSYDITTTTTYNLSFVLPGQGAQTIQLTAPPSPPATLPVQEIQTLVSYAR